MVLVPYLVEITAYEYPFPAPTVTSLLITVSKSPAVGTEGARVSAYNDCVKKIGVGRRSAVTAILKIRGEDERKRCVA